MRLPESEIHLWPVPLDEPPSPDAIGTLSPLERQRAARYHCPRARQRFVGSRAALRRILGDYLGARPSAVPLELTAHGKPRLAATDTPLQFNLSHSDTQAIIAVSREPVGVDIERRDASLDWRALMPLCCHPEERGRLERQPHDALDTFLTLWTCKEAYVKGRGLGLQLPLPAVRVGLNDGRPHLRIDPPWCDGRHWSLHLLSGLGPFAGSVATVIPDAVLRRHSFNPSSQGSPP